MIAIENVTIEFVWDATLKRLCHKINFSKTGDTENEVVTISIFPEGGFDSAKIDDNKVGEFNDTDTISYLINTAKIHSYNYSFERYYFHLTTSNEVYGPFSFDHVPSKEMVQIKYEHERSMRRKGGYGIKSWIFKKNKIAENCSTCWNEARQMSDDPHCTVCGGAGKVDLYTDPYPFYCHYGMHSLIESDLGTHKLNEQDIVAWSVQPKVFPDDIIVRDIDKKIFSVSALVNNVGQANFTVRQIYKLIETKPGDTFYSKLEEL